MDALPFLTELRDGIASRLQDMVLETSDAEEFFQELAVFSASLLSPPESKVHCNVTVARRKKPVTVACSDARARAMDELQYAFGDGPCLTAMRTGMTIYVPDVSREHRWPEYIQAVSKKGVQSILGVPLRLEGESTAALNIYSSRPHGITGGDIARAELFGKQSAKTLRLELRLTQLQEANDNLEAAMKNRTVIDIAIGVIMAQNRCSQDAAITILRRASGSRNIKLRDVAAGVIESVSPHAAALRTHFDE
ncbi:GAF and ANTAR domain-containing protein [Pseudarthrobacter sp. BRE9]|uniref:GAF and ANTAR domain-containing protein n=1 Tax=Pseudarthrobacter sp. BRE9 TaxID=2962582 RepID=UPI002881AEE4|nr:GAF and ANTAR domain-containing protein [Pseudarthrobacter sp. BRE9]MDT0168854.1 GAF and ANTAR domain-containing protein [Pseudarthrobacter sp. BRE9]